MKIFKARFSNVIDIIGFIAMAVIVIVCFIQVICRYFLEKSIFWAEELSVYLMIWAAFLGAAKATVYQENTRLGFIIKAFPTKLRVILECIAYLFTLIFLVFLVYYGFQLAGTQWNRYSAAVGIPMALVYGALPISGIFMVVFTAISMIESIGNLFLRKEVK